MQNFVSFIWNFDMFLVLSTLTHSQNNKVVPALWLYDEIYIACPFSLYNVYSIYEASDGT